MSGTRCEKQMLEGHAFLPRGTNATLFSGHDPMYPDPPNPEQLLWLGTSSSLWTRRSSLGRWLEAMEGDQHQPKNTTLPVWCEHGESTQLWVPCNLQKTYQTLFELGTAWPFTAGVSAGSSMANIKTKLAHHGRFIKGAKHATEHFIVGYVCDDPTLAHENNAAYMQ